MNGNPDGMHADAISPASTADDELERLKARRLVEMQKNIHAQKMKEQSERSPDDVTQTITPRDIVIKSLGFRGLEVLEAAEVQYPSETSMILQRLADVITSENIAEYIDGGQLMSIFRMLGMPVKIQTSIKIEDDGKFVSLSEKLRSKKS